MLIIIPELELSESDDDDPSSLESDDDPSESLSDESELLSIKASASSPSNTLNYNIFP